MTKTEQAAAAAVASRAALARDQGRDSRLGYNPL